MVPAAFTCPSTASRCPLATARIPLEARQGSVRNRFEQASNTHRSTACRSLGKDAAGSFFDLSKLMASDSAKKGTFDDLAHAIGQDAYADLNGWHLFLKDMSVQPGGPKMHGVLAEQLGSQILTDRFDAKHIEDFLTKVPVKLGQGKKEVSLDSVLPAACVQDIVKACEEFSKA